MVAIPYANFKPFSAHLNPPLAVTPRSRNLQAHARYCRENLPMPTRTWMVLMPGFGVERPALEMCM
jgi:hypothetical protein